MGKGKKANRANSWQNSQPSARVASGNQISGLYAETGKAHEGLRKELPSDESVAELPVADAETQREMNALQGEKRADLEATLRSIMEISVQTKDLLQKLRLQEYELAARQDALREQGETLALREKECASKEYACAQRSEEIAQKAGKLVDLDRALIDREENARQGFVAQKESALSDLKNELESLKMKCKEERERIAAYERESTARLQARERELSDAEMDLTERERRLEQRSRRLEAERRGIEHDRASIRQEVEDVYRREIAACNDKLEREKANCEKAYAENTSLEEELNGYRHLRRALNGRKPEDMLDELQKSRAFIAELEAKIAESDDVGLKLQVDGLREERDVERQKVDDLGRELNEARSELNRLRLGVMEKEGLEREKRILEKHKLLLERRLQDLEGRVDTLTASQQAESPFPQLSWMDSATKELWVAERAATELELDLKPVPDLKEFASELQQRVAQAEECRELYFELEDIRLLLAGMAMSQLHIFQGISGTGKTSLAKALAKAIGGSCTDIAVQAGWRDRDDLLGHFNSFEKRFYERDCLQGLYRAQTDFYADRCNIILLDEMNLSRPEQYFAEFLSALEKIASSDRLISLSEGVLPHAPRLLVEGRKIRVPANVWFIGTANHDESTNEFADKTYDRANVMTLPKNEERFGVTPLDPAAFSFRSLMQRFDDAIGTHEKQAGELLEELTTGDVGRVLQGVFDLGWGNRFERQVMRFVPVFIAAGGKAEDAMDHLLASRVFRRGKVVGRHDVSGDDIGRLRDAVERAWKTFSANPKRSLALLEEDRKRKERGL